jgi:hypothetical protein
MKPTMLPTERTNQETEMKNNIEDLNNTITE